MKKKGIKKKVVKKIVKKTVKKSVKKKKPAIKKQKVLKPIGAVTHYYTEIKVAIVKFKKPIRVGAELQFKGATTDFVEVIKSMQYDHKSIKIAPKGKLIGIKVKKRVREGDAVYEI
jgi:hypothetical protein